MTNRIKINEFMNLTGSTLKTVLYYHKIGLLPEPERSLAGYRLYGPEELSRMQFIKYLKALGLDLKRIKEILGDQRNDKSMREVLQSLHHKLVSEKNSLEKRIAKVEQLLDEDTVSLDEERFDSPSFQTMMDILGSDQMELYSQIAPDLLAQQRNVSRILDDFAWGINYSETARSLAEFFKKHPKEYQTALAYGARLGKLAQLSADDPAVEALALKSAAFVKRFPELKKLLSKQAGFQKSLANLYDDMVANVVSPAQRKFGQLLHEYLTSELGEAGENDNDN